jgi:hypothetical protein
MIIYESGSGFKVNPIYDCQITGDDEEKPSMTPAREPELVSRDESQDDYDLLTYREVAARLSEEIVAESQRIAEFEASGADPKALEESKRRLASLQASTHRYEQHAKTADVFMQRFGLRPRISAPGEQ